MSSRRRIPRPRPRRAIEPFFAFSRGPAPRLPFPQSSFLPMLKPFLLFCAATALFSTLKAELVISEIMASNTATQREEHTEYVHKDVDVDSRAH